MTIFVVNRGNHTLRRMESGADLVEMLGLQLCEVEMLQCMFPNPGEFVLDDITAVSEVREFVDGKISYDLLSSRIGFTVKLQIEQTPKQTMELVCHFPHEYPAMKPDIFLRAPSIARTEYKRLTDDLSLFINELERGEICIGPVIEWINENSENYLKVSDSPKKSEKVKPAKDSVFSRMWIYSHHLYSKIKRKDILEISSELNLSGFSMPGKPGIIVIEGYASDVEDFWQRIRRMQWKRLVMKEKEDLKIDGKDIDSLRKFVNFEEKMFDPRQGKGRGAHMDLGLLYQFLEEKGCSQIFHIFFGVEGKPTKEDDEEDGIEVE